MAARNKASDFLRAMSADAAEIATPTAPAPKLVPAVKVAKVVLPTAEKPKAKPAKPTRAELKHIGGYFDQELVEKVAILRVRLKKDNSELIQLAVEDLYRKHTAKRAFGDA